MDVHLALPVEYAGTAQILHDYDPRLRLRKSVDHTDLYVLEIQSLKGCPVDPRELTGHDRHVAAAENYLHICYVHPSFLHHPARILEELRAHDLWHQVGRGPEAAARYEQQLVDDELARRQQRRKTRRDWLHHTARDAFDILNRTGGVGGTEVSRWNNPGFPSLTGDPATHGGPHERSTATTVRACDGDDADRLPGASP
jgi:hypothetical protein